MTLFSRLLPDRERSLAIMAIGFIQSLYALDAADGQSGGGVIVINGLIQALLG